jgi:hypothetical protein
MKIKKILSVIIISFIVIFGTILFTKPKQVVSINLNYAGKADENTIFIYDLTYLYRIISTFVKKYYMVNIVQNEYALNTYNVYAEELIFIKDVFEDLNKLFNYTRPSKINDLLAQLELKDNDYKISQDQFQKLKDYISSFTYKISEKKFLDQRTGKVTGSSISIKFTSNVIIDKKEARILGNILEKHITSNFLNTFNTRVNQILNIAEEQVYNSLMEKAEMYNSLQKDIDNKNIDKGLIEEIKYDYKKMKNIYVKFNQLDEKYNKNLKLVEYDKISISTYRGLIPQNAFFALLFGLFFFINVVYALMINKKIVLYIKKLIK